RLGDVDLHIRLHNRKSFRREIEHRAIERFDFWPLLFGHRREMNAGFDVRGSLLESGNPYPLDPLNDQLDLAFGTSSQLSDDGLCAEGVKTLRSRIIFRGVALRHYRQF